MKDVNKYLRDENWGKCGGWAKGERWNLNYPLRDINEKQGDLHDKVQRGLEIVAS